jgi:hypothetical protein
MTILTSWIDFYIILGSAAAVLIGLQFVSISLAAIRPPKESEASVAGMFSTPNILHFGAVLVIAAVASAPWPEIFYPTVLLVLIGIYGLIYSIITIRRVWLQKVYKPLLYDWFFYTILPIVIYLVIVISAFAILIYTELALFFIAGSAVSLLLVAIHNTWDSATYNVFVRLRS